MKNNYDENQILLAKHLKLIPENSDFIINFDLIQQVARLKLKDFNNWLSLSNGKRTSLWKLYTRTSAINLLKYKDECGYNKDLKESFVYILADEKFKNHYKIGRTIEPERRLSECNVYSPYKSFKMVSWIFSDNAINDEKFFHEKYSEDHLEGEWFYFPDVEEIRKDMVSYFNKVKVPTNFNDYLNI